MLVIIIIDSLAISDVEKKNATTLIVDWINYKNSTGVISSYIFINYENKKTLKGKIQFI